MHDARNSPNPWVRLARVRYERDLAVEALKRILARDGSVEDLALDALCEIQRPGEVRTIAMVRDWRELDDAA